MKNQSVQRLIKNRKRWFVIANRIETVIYRDGPTQLAFVKRLSNPEGQLAERLLDSDKPGRGLRHAGRATIHHVFGRHFEHHEQAAIQFARAISQALEKAYQEAQFTELVLVAEPHFLGILRSELPASLKSLVSEEINREFSQGSANDFREWFAKQMEVSDGEASVPMSHRKKPVKVERQPRQPRY